MEQMHLQLHTLLYGVRLSQEDMMTLLRDVQTTMIVEIPYCARHTTVSWITLSIVI